jgi:hypothetical protein
VASLHAHGGYRRVLAYGLSLAPVLSGCDGGSIEPLDIERLAFVPPGRCTIASGVDCSTDVALLVDRFEVTLEHWLALMDEQYRPPREFRTHWTSDTGQYPITGMNLAEARVFAGLRGMRIPTVSEWMRIATGTAAQPWPWSAQDRESAANIEELGLDRTAPVGTFERGRTTDGVHDMLGNVWEWTEPPLPPGVIPFSAISDTEHLGSVTVHTQPNWVMGGSYLSGARTLHGHDRRKNLYFFAEAVDPRHRGIDIGLRCIADAEVYLWKHAPEWDDAAIRQRLVAVGERWGGRAVVLLQRLSQRPGAPDALTWLLEGALQ